ncbi:MAG: hypothetical protein LC722_07505, partial [Actinobacteria bacterium]|nr:hypothetical protein [Actinomycetota bacterium]
SEGEGTHPTPSARHMRTRLPVAILTALTLATLVPTVPAHADGGKYLVGVASRSINPDPDGSFAGKPVHLGGFGFSNGKVLGIQTPIGEPRTATGIMPGAGYGVASRAFLVSDGERTIALASIETQGMFIAYRGGPFGLLDMRKAVERETGGRISAQGVVISADHSHGGPDTIGVWGGVPKEYLRYVKDQTVGAILDAWRSMRPAVLSYGTADGRDLLANQFDYDPKNQSLDTEVRVLQGRDPVTGEVVGTLTNFSAHATVIGSGNRLATADWPGPTSQMLADEYGAGGVTIVGTVGRTQPGVRGCPAGFAQPGESTDHCALRHYASLVMAKVRQAVANASVLPEPARVDARSYLIQDAATNPALLAMAYLGGLVGAPILRSPIPPWFTANLVSTSVQVVRIGDVILSAGPGEMYPQIAERVRKTVPARGFMTAGLAGDQLGYLIAPFPSAFPEPIRRSFFDNDTDPLPTGQPEPLDNDNFFFDISPTIGDRVTCAFLRGHSDLLGADDAFWARYPKCRLFTNDHLFPAGFDTLMPTHAGSLLGR